MRICIRDEPYSPLALQMPVNPAAAVLDHIEPRQREERDMTRSRPWSPLDELPRWLGAAAAAIAVLLNGCGGAGDTSSTAGSPPAASTGDLASASQAMSSKDDDDEEDDDDDDDDEDGCDEDTSRATPAGLMKCVTLAHVRTRQRELQKIADEIGRANV